MKKFECSFTIDRVPHSLNKKLRTHWRGQRKESKSWDVIIMLEADQLKPASPLNRAKLSLTRHSHRMLDYDGLVGSMKPVVDALVECGFLRDDSWGVTGQWNVDQVFRSQSEGQMLEVSIIEGT